MKWRFTLHTLSTPSNLNRATGALSYVKNVKTLFLLVREMRVPSDVADDNDDDNGYCYWCKKEVQKVKMNCYYYSYANIAFNAYGRC